MPEKPAYEFQLEAKTYSVPPEITQGMRLLIDDKDTTLREKLIAQAYLALAQTLNDLVVSLDSGTVTLRVYENNIVREPGPHPRKRPPPG